MSEVATIECPFCASTLKAHATVCPNCHADRGAGTDSEGNIHGSGYVAFFRVVLGVWAMVILIAVMNGVSTGEEGPFIWAFCLAIGWFAVFVRNLGLVFNSGKEDRWYRKG